MILKKCIFVSFILTLFLLHSGIKAQTSCSEARNYFKIENYSKALDSSDKCLAENPRNIEVRLIRAQIFEKFNQNANAVSDYAVLIELDVDNPFILVKAGIAAYNEKQYKMADIAFEKAKYVSDTSIQNTDILFTLDEEGFVKSVKDYRFLPDVIEYYQVLSYFQQSDDLALLSQLNEDNQFKPASHVDQYVFNDKIHNAINENLLSELTDEMLGLRINEWLNYLTEHNRLSTAVSLMKELANRGVDMNNYSDKLIFLLLNNEMPIPDSIELDNLTTEKTEEFYNIGLAKEKQGQLDKADIIYKMVIQENPEYVKAIMGRGNVAFKRENFKEAIEWYSLAIQYDSKHINAYHNRAMAYFSIDKKDLGCKDLENLMDLDDSLAKDLINEYCFQ